MKNKIIPKNIEQLIEAVQERHNLNYKFKPNIWYNKIGDILNVETSEQYNVYSKWINPYITIKIEEKTEKIVGIQIWNYKKLKNNTKKINQEEEKWIKENKNKFSYDLDSSNF